MMHKDDASPKEGGETNNSRQISKTKMIVRKRKGRWAWILGLYVVLCWIGLSIATGTSDSSSNHNNHGGSKWLHHRLQQLIAKEPSLHTNLKGPTTTTTALTQTTSDETPLLVVVTQEGQVWTLDANDGSLVAGFSTGPPLLVMDHDLATDTEQEDDLHDQQQQQQQSNHWNALSKFNIVPSVDGILYWRQAERNGELVPIAAIRDLVDNPIQICHSASEEAEEENLCDILTATSLGPSLFSLNAQGSLNWARGRSSSASASQAVQPRSEGDSDSDSDTEDDDSTSSSSTDESSSSSNSNSSRKLKKSSLLLQRQDYLVQQISTATGEQVWNLTWSSLEALDFVGGGAAAASANSEDDDVKGSQNSRRNNNNVPFGHGKYLPSGEEHVQTSEMPSLIFANQGQSLAAVTVTEPNPKFLWKRDFLSQVTNIMGIEFRQWQAVDIVDEYDQNQHDGYSNNHDHNHNKEYTRPRLQDTESHEQQQEQQQQRDKWYWFWAGGGAGMGKKKKAPSLREIWEEMTMPRDDHGLVFVPRPDAHHLVRNSWYLNHLWENSPQAQGAQRFQGHLLSDQPHKDDNDSESDSQGRAGEDNMDSSDHSLSSSNRPHQPGTPPDFLLYDTSTMPKLLLLPPSEYGALPSNNNTGGVFLSWTVITAIVSLLVGATGVAFVIYDQKKQQWLMQQINIHNNPSENGGSGVDVKPSETAVLSRVRSISVGNEMSASNVSIVSALQAEQNRDDQDNSADALVPSMKASFASTNKPSYKNVLLRSTSAPLMSRDHNSDDVVSNAAPITKTTLLGNNSTHSGGENSPPPRRSSSPTPPSNRSNDKPIIAEPAKLLKHQSAPVTETTMTASSSMQNSSIVGGVGMIDGIPLIRYSRYQSEFREIEPLGRGGFGTVFRVANMLDGREYAVKKVSIRSSDWNSPGTEAFSQELHRVLREVKFLALLDHPNIVRYYTAWLEMEESDGKNNSGADDNTSSRKLSRRYSSELLTELEDDTNNQTSTRGHSESYSRSSPYKGRRPSYSRRTPSHLKARNATNPLGWNNDFDNFDESSAASASYYPKHTMPVINSMEDCGFIFEERSDEEEEEMEPSFGGTKQRNQFYDHSSDDCSKSEHSGSMSSAWDASFSLQRHKNKKAAGSSRARHDTTSNMESTQAERRNSKSTRHTLYIQMQLCSSKTLGDFLSNKEARRGSAPSLPSDSVDIPCALRLFLQIVQAVHHVHQQGLIHRDLKPSNCFIDDTGTVKVGDFGLSRESNAGNEEDDSTSLILESGQQDELGAGDHTVGVGTRSYASPEQMKGSDYDSKTDIYSLGVMLFELLYPMYTGMERHICLQKLRTAGTFPDAWHANVSTPFPSLNDLVKTMLSLTPKDRPPADKVSRQIQNLLEEHSVSLNIGRHDAEHDNVIFVRVEAKPVPDILKSTIHAIHDSAAPNTVEIVQYGMRSSTEGNSGTTGGSKQLKKKAILEFALSCTEIEKGMLFPWGSSLVAKLAERDEILVARHVWHQNHSTQISWSS